MPDDAAEAAVMRDEAETVRSAALIVRKYKGGLGTVIAVLDQLAVALEHGSGRE